MTDYLIIGTGLAASGAARALIEKGIRPLVFDTAQTLSPENWQDFEEMLHKSPYEWGKELHDRFYLPEKAAMTSIPKKTIFRSSYFAEDDGDYSFEHQPPPTSHAFGGLSIGWGASVLPITQDDIKDWPVKYAQLRQASDHILSNLPYSCEDDDLSLEFPLPKTMACSAFDIPEEEQKLLKQMRKKNPPVKGSFCLGRARQLVRHGHGSKACQYCGHCMGGCVFRSIYSSADEFALWNANGLINFHPKRKVQKLIQVGDKVQVSYLENNQEKDCFVDRVFVAAGAFNSSRIYLQSCQHASSKLELQSRGGFVVPMFSLKAVRNPNKLKNTLPTMFIEHLDPFSKSWVHTQVSIGNELLERRLIILAERIPALRPIIWFFLRRTLVLLVNFHSKHGGTYQLHLKQDAAGTNCLKTRYIRRWPALSSMLYSVYKLTAIFLKSGCFPIWFLLKLNSGSYHVGGALKMSPQPVEENQTNLLGQPDESAAIHYVDSSIFPSLPGTSIGLISIANAYRIAQKTVNND